MVSEGHERGDGVAEQRLSRKEIRQPDQFVSLSVQIVAWIKAHTRSLLYGVVALVVGITLITGWWAWQKHREQQADIALYEAAKFLQMPAANRTKAVEALQRLVSEYESTAAAAMAYWHLGHLHFEGERLSCRAYSLSADTTAIEQKGSAVAGSLSYPGRGLCSRSQRYL